LTHERVFLVFCQHTRGLAIARICELRANCRQLLALLCDSAHVAGSHVRKSRKAGTCLAAMCGLPAFLSYTHTQNPGTCIRCTPVPGLGAATPGHVILTLRAPRAAAGAAGRARGGPRIRTGGYCMGGNYRRILKDRCIWPADDKSALRHYDCPHTIFTR
jgi:hypothetical protein